LRHRLVAWVFAAAALAAMPASAVPGFAEVPGFADVKAAHRPSDLTLLDRHGQPLQTLRVDRAVRRLPWVPLDEMSPALVRAVVQSEDRRFWEHAGIDWPAVARSAWANTIDRRTQGASTLTMQLAGLVDDGLARPSGGRSVWQKLGQAVVARRIEGAWSKSQILEAYLNSVPLRGEVVGIGALAQTMFGKHPSGLDAAEAAITAALVRGPNAGAERVGERACGVLKTMGEPCDGVRALAATALARRPGMALGEQLAPHFARRVLAPGGAATQRSTLDSGVQRLAIAALRSQLAELSGRNVEDGAVVVLDNVSGEVLAWVGANGASSVAAQVDGVLARRQPGSTLKPFVYGLAFERRLITPASLLDDSPAEINTAGGLYLPRNYDRDFKGLVSARSALGSSLNVPAVRVGAMLAPDALHRRLNALGFDLRESGGWYGASLALGSADVTLLALANAYRTLANGGLVSPVVTVPGTAKAKPVRVADAAASWLVADILADNNARVRTFGADSALRTRGFAAVKTGTSKDMRDNWCLGFTDRYTVAVWVGNASGEPMHDVSGISGAAPVWAAIVQALHRGSASRAPAPPRGVERWPVQFVSTPAAAPIEPPRDEWFLAGSAPPSGRVSPRGGSVPIGITSPADGSVFALDPDIPPGSQRITFEGERGSWVLDGRVVATGIRHRWAPWPGRHRLELRAADGRVIEQVDFEVRGAGIRAVRAGRPG